MALFFRVFLLMRLDQM